jgi:hypothetical protein
MIINTETSGPQVMEGTDILPLPIYVTMVWHEVPCDDEINLWAAMDAVCRSLEIGEPP